MHDQSIPHLIQLQTEYEIKNTVIFGSSVGSSNFCRIRKFVKSRAALVAASFLFAEIPSPT